MWRDRVAKERASLLTAVSASNCAWPLIMLTAVSLRPCCKESVRARSKSSRDPKATRIAWSLKKDDILKDQHGMTRRKFLYNLSRASYQKNWGKRYKPPTFGERFFAFLTRILPKIGPLKVLQLKTPTPAAE